MWGSFLYYNAEVVHNGDKIKLRDAVGNFIKSPAVQVSSKCDADSTFLGWHRFLLRISGVLVQVII
jgi:hypothetical protein